MDVWEALIVGLALKKTSTRRRICFVNDVPRHTEHLLNAVWEIEKFTYLELHGFTGVSKRLTRIDSKLQAWTWLADEPKADVMLDTALYIKRSFDGTGEQEFILEYVGLQE